MPRKAAAGQSNLSEFPGYRAGSVPQYADYHAEVDYRDEVERIWGKRWGAPGIGRLREVAMSTPTEAETLPLYDEDPAFFAYGGALPDLGLMREQHAALAETYRSLGIEVHEFVYPETPRSAYGVMKRAISVAAGFVIDGGAILPREAAPYWRGRSRYVAGFLNSIGCPVLMTVHGKGVCEIGAFTRMADDFMVGMLSTDCNQEGLDQVEPVLERLGYRLWAARVPGPLYDYHPEVPGWMHSDMWIAPLDARLAIVYPPWFDYETIRYLRSIGYRLIEPPRDEQEAAWPLNMITIEPRKVVMAEGSPKTRALLDSEGVETIEVPYGEVMKYGGGVRCTTMQLVRDAGPRVFE
jgi:N-dimethylarginine dimethylaminohydrolase